MQRLAIDAVTSSAALVGLALVPLWWRSPRVCDWVTFVRASGDTVRLSTHPHGLTLGWSDANRNPSVSPWPFAWLHPGWNCGAFAEGPVTITKVLTSAGPGGSVTVWSSSGWYSWQPYGVHAIGFGLDRRTVSLPTYQSTVGTNGVTNGLILSHVASVYVPFWCVVPLCSAPAAVLLWTRLRHRRRFAVGHCHRCGYDLRASPGRCPECGAKPAGRSPQSSGGCHPRPDVDRWGTADPIGGFVRTPVTRSADGVPAGIRRLTTGARFEYHDTYAQHHRPDP